MFTDNLSFAQGGGLTSRIIPKVFDKPGIALGFGLTQGAVVGRNLLAQHNKLKAGPMTYTGGPAKMTSNFDSGAVEAIMKSTNDPETRADIVRHMLRSQETILENVREYGIDEEFMNSFYGMR